MAERTLPGLGLTGFWDLGAEGWNEGMDPNLLTLSVVAQLSVLSATTELPGSPSDGDIYIVPSGGNANRVAVRDDGSWVYLVPVEGWRAWVRDTNMLVIFDGSAWVEFEAGGGGGDGEFDSVGINADADPDDKLFVKSDGVVFTHDDVTPGTGDILFKLNKAATGRDAGFALSTSWVVKALVGLMGDNGYGIRVSADGSTFFPGLHIDSTTGHIGLGTNGDPGNRLVVRGTSALFDAETDDFRFVFNKATASDDAALTFQTGYSGRALIGLLGSDDFVFTVSPDGSTYEQALVIDKDTAVVDLPKNAKFSASVNYDAYIPADAWTKIPFNDASAYNDQSAFDDGENEFVAPVGGLYNLCARFNFKLNNSPPDVLELQLFVNDVAVPRTLGRWFNDWGNEKITIEVSGLLLLDADDVVDARLRLTTNDGYVEENTNAFYGFRVI